MGPKKTGTYKNVCPAASLTLSSRVATLLPGDNTGYTLMDHDTP